MDGLRTALRQNAHHCLAAALLAAFFLQSFLASRIKSPTSDEVPHIAAGMSYLQANNFRPNPQHPPLIKEIAAVALLIRGISLPASDEVRGMFQEQGRVQLEWAVGSDLIASSGTARTMSIARLPMMVIATLLGLLVYVWGSRLFGKNAGLAALFLYSLDPILIAHAQLVTTDVGLAAFTTLFFFALWHYVRQPTPMRLVLCGLTMGLALTAKYSAVFMIPLAAPLMLVSDKGPSTGRLWRCAERSLAMCGIAALVIMAVYRSPAGLSMYWQGHKAIYLDHDPNHLVYMAGDLDSTFYTYFAVAWLLKEPIAIVITALLGSLLLLRDKATGRSSDKLFVLLPPAALFVACSIWAHDIGVRYIIPCIPFACIAGGVGLSALVRQKALWSNAAAFLLCVWAIVAVAGIYPDHLSYFNEAACLLSHPREIGLDGGSKCGIYWLDDSNVDWGQGLEQLQVWLRAHPDTRQLRMDYFGSFGPEHYGILSQPSGITESDDRPQPGLYAISAHVVARFTDSWLRTIPPRALVGHAYYIFDIRPKYP